MSPTLPTAVDGYGAPFDPELHWRHVRTALLADEARRATEGVVPHSEPVWTDRPAGFRVCPAIHEDTDCEQFPA